MASRRNRNQQDVRKMTENVKDIDLFTPMNDIIFKGIFAKNTEKSNRLLGSLISSVIGKPVGKVTLVNNEPAANSTEDKNIRMDVVCMTKHAGIVDIEVQIKSADEDILKRLEFYTARNFVQSQSKGRGYDELQPAYAILITRKPVIMNGRFEEWFAMRNGSGDIKIGLQNIVILQLSYLKTGTQLDCLDEWCIFLEKGNRKTAETLVSGFCQEVKEASEVFMELTADLRERLLEIQRDKAADIERVRAKRMKAESFAEGAAAGKREMAKAMRAKGIDIAAIAEISGLSEEEIRAL